MALHKGHMKQGFKLPDCEKHFHDYDETWLILKGKGNGYWIDHQGQRVDFELEGGDVWMIPAGYEHGSDGPNSDDFEITVFLGTMPTGSHAPGHYYVERERYIPILKLARIPTERYPRPEEDKS
ncbi:MAG: cupin domain-containing protein [Candidatus Sumerlaeia bacterium]|nr:cupin domain-containing protein [Candidatus Sumerlaeia bacterium]